jgi:D-alanyl-D-alanine carboxypeptidase
MICGLFLFGGRAQLLIKTGPYDPFLSPCAIFAKQAGALLFCGLLLCLQLVARPALAIDASIVIDANSDTVISQENPDRLLHPASMSKLMTLYLAFEALEGGRITLQRTFPVSAHAESMSPTKLNLVAGQTIKVEDLILSMVTLSANDSAVVLAEGLGGSEDRFAQLMTRKAHQLGMVNSNFRNSNGLPDPAQISTARDMAILCRALIRHFPQYYHYFSVREFTYNGIEHANHNHLMSRYEGMDGLKTGLTNASGFNLAASAIRNGRRLIGVVFGGTSAVQRDDYMADLLDEGFRRTSSVAMTTAVPPPVPVHKPSELTNTGVPAAAVASSSPLEPKPIGEVAPEKTGQNGVSLNAQRPTTIAELSAVTGQGDVEAPDDVKPAAKPKASGERVAMLVTPRSQREKAKKAEAVSEARWSIQVGAYATRAATEAAIKQAVKKVPGILKNAKVVVAALPQKHGTIYRGRLSGLEANDARKACHLLTHCMTVPPGAS